VYGEQDFGNVFKSKYFKKGVFNDFERKIRQAYARAKNSNKEDEWLWGREGKWGITQSLQPIT